MRLVRDLVGCTLAVGGGRGVTPQHTPAPAPTGLPMDCLLADPTELEPEASGQCEADTLRKWYEQEVGYDPVTDDPSMTLKELRELCSGFAEEAGIASPVVARG